MTETTSGGYARRASDGTSTDGGSNPPASITDAELVALVRWYLTIPEDNHMDHIDRPLAEKLMQEALDRGLLGDALKTARA